MPTNDPNEHELEEFRKNAKQTYEARINLLRELSTIDPSAIALPCTQAKTLCYLANVERYFKNVGLRWTIESLLDSSATIARVEETLRLTQLVSELESLIVAFEIRVVNLKREHYETSHFESIVDVEIEALAERFQYIKLEHSRL